MEPGCFRENIGWSANENLSFRDDFRPRDPNRRGSMARQRDNSYGSNRVFPTGRKYGGGRKSPPDPTSRRHSMSAQSRESNKDQMPVSSKTHRNWDGSQNRSKLEAFLESIGR